MQSVGVRHGNHGPHGTRGWKCLEAGIDMGERHFGKACGSQGVKGLACHVQKSELYPIDNHVPLNSFKMCKHGCIYIFKETN